MRSAGCSAGFVLASLLTLSGAAAAGEASDQPPSQEQSTSAQAPRRSADFLFGRPRAAVGIRGSWIFASAGSDIFDFVTRQLTLDKSDFNTPGFAADVAFSVSSRADVVVGLELSRVSRDSEYRDFVDNRLQPIEQTTALNATHLVGSVRYALGPKGTDVSRLAWVPSRLVPYVGAGAGVAYYQFRQYGDFVDFEDLSVFPESFRSTGWSPTAHVFGGLDVRLYRGIYGTVEGRYTAASGKLGADFVDFDPIDLSGFRMAAGINVVF